MKQVQVGSNAEKKRASPPPPLPLQLFPRYWMKQGINSISARSVTNEEIAKFWRKKKMDEEDHLLAAIKAAARIRARNLSEQDYKQFEESLEDENREEKNKGDMKNSKDKDENNKEIRIGMMDW
ncbi:hypothetical protein IFM89_027581 [Coptis chinensis]|uniref:Uncharacterized protein n=1 Tax=Coptis chinensis TaxID=261450 RepID=A0A835M9T8_9MAGN|nr:hypothetical protein IFM89_027581 [Coptis chinensis]